MTPHPLRQATSTAAVPNLVARIRSSATGEPPRCTCPRTVTRVSKPVRRSISGAIRWAIPPKRGTLVRRSDSSPAPSSPRPAVRPRPRRRWRTGARRDVVAVGGRGGPRGRTAARGDHVGTPGETRRQGDPSRVPPHQLRHDDAVVTLGGAVQPVDSVGGDLNGRAEPDAGFSPDRSLSMVFGTPMTDMPSSDMCAAAPSVPSPPIAINPSSARSAKVCRTFFDPTFVVRIRPGAPQDRAAPMQDALHRLLRQLPDPQQRCRRAAARSRDVPPRIAEVEQWATSPSSNGSTRSDDATSGASFDRAAASCSSISAGSPRPARRSSASSATPSGRRRGSRPGPWRRRRATRGPRGPHLPLHASPLEGEAEPVRHPV
jgi:hypothetical protein